MSKNFDPKYIVDLTKVQTIKEVEDAVVFGKIKASSIREAELAEMAEQGILNQIRENNADALVIYANGVCEYVNADNLVREASKVFTDIINDIQSIVKKEKKEPWYKRLWHKIFPKKNK